MRQVIHKALTVAVQEAYCRARGDVEPGVDTPMDNPRSILVSLHMYNNGTGRKLLQKREEATQQWDEAWNRSKPIENMFSKLKSCTFRL